MKHVLLLISLLALAACETAEKPAAKTASGPTAEIDTGTVAAGSFVTMRGTRMDLSHGSINMNGPLPTAELTDIDWKAYQFKGDGKIKVVSVVPSIDTKVCEQQTHILGESKLLNPLIERITLSRDLPAAQKRFALDSNLTNVKYLSDFKTGGFGKEAGLFIEKSGLLARAVLVVDGEGLVRYVQVVPDVSKLPDMDKAFTEANKLIK